MSEPRKYLIFKDSASLCEPGDVCFVGGIELPSTEVVEYSAYQALEENLRSKDVRIAELEVELALSSPLYSRRELEEMHKNFIADIDYLEKENALLTRKLEKAIEQRNVFHTICDENDLTVRTIEQLDSKLAAIGSEECTIQIKD